MRNLMPRHLNDDRGATAVIIALCLIVIFAMLMLTVDVGGLLYKRRELVNGADAAALAAAQSCAITTDSDNPEVIADQYAADNVKDLAGAGIAGITNITEAPGCDSRNTGHVTVSYSMSQDLYFAEVLGFSQNSPVRAEATAAWGPLAGGNAVPVVLESGHLQSDCEIPNPTFDPGDPPICAFWYNNNDPMGNASWGFMNLDQWNVAGDENCSNAGSSDRSDWIINDYPDQLSLNGDPPGSAPTYVCVDTGHSSRDWADLKDQEGQLKLFPVNDCSGQLNKSGTVVPCPSTPDKYDIIGFTTLMILHTYKGNDPLAIGSPGPSGTCTVDPYTFFAAGAGTQLDLDTVTSTTANSSGCPTSTATATYSGLTLDRVSGKDPACCTPGVDYTYDATQHLITWTAGRRQDVRIGYDWQMPGSTGACPGHTSDPNAICLVTEWHGFSVGPGPIGTGADLGDRAIRLCDLKVTGSCPPGA
jgi:Flp pilus assembly protein TadG